MKVGIMTFHRAINYGAILQVLALQKSIEKFNVEVEVIDYRCEKIEKDYSNIRIRKNTVLNDTINSVLSYPIRRKKKNNFLKFMNNNLNLSKEVYYSIDDLFKSNEFYDLFVTGSDQVWDNKCVNFDKAYFLSFVNEAKKKNSYAASFAFGELPSGTEEEYCNRLCDFENISVREDIGVSIFGKLLNREINVNLDPTLLLEKDEWTSYTNENAEKEKYILVYTVNAPKELLKYAENISNKLGCKIIYINDSFKKKAKAEYLRGASPSEFLTLFKNAEIVLTNSFHGTVFSIIFEKKFVVELNSKTNKVNHRSKHLLEFLKLEKRILENIKNDQWGNDIDYENVRLLLRNERKRAVIYLEELLKKPSYKAE